MRHAARYTSTRFVGREEAFGRLAQGLDDAAHGVTRTLLLGGTAGVGVTRFLDEAIERMRRAARADDRPARKRLAGQCRRAVRPDRPGDRPGPARPAGR